MHSTATERWMELSSTSSPWEGGRGGGGGGGGGGGSGRIVREKGVKRIMDETWRRNKKAVFYKNPSFEISCSTHR